MKKCLLNGHNIDFIFKMCVGLFPLFMVLMLLLPIKTYGCEHGYINTIIHVYKIDYKTDTVYCNGYYKTDVNKLNFVLYNVPDLHIHDLLYITIDTNNHDICKWVLYQSWNNGTLIYKNMNIDTSKIVCIWKWYKQNGGIKLKRNAIFIFESY